jgi:NTE family protein
MDGALVNPIPITVARAMGADLVICVNLNGDIRIRGTVIQSHGPEEDEVVEAVLQEPRRWALFGRRETGPKRPTDAPGIAAVMMDAFNITQDRIARSRLAGDPPDVMICPKLSPVGLFEFHRADDCIELGREATERALPDIYELLEAARKVV